MYTWGKKGKMLVLTGVYVCVQEKLTLVSFIFLVFFCTFPLVIQIVGVCNLMGLSRERLAERERRLFPELPSMGNCTKMILKKIFFLSCLIFVKLKL